MKTTNLQYLTDAACKLRPLLEELVFVGGIVVGLLATDPGAPEARSTLDVDALAGIASYSEYADFGERLRKLGFREDSSEDAPICRWRNGTIALDILPSDEGVLGFSSRWYRRAMDTAIPIDIQRFGSVNADIRDRPQVRLGLQGTVDGAHGLTVRVVAAPVFLATKFEAFRARGGGDLLCSTDLEDIIALVDGRATLLDELRLQASDLQSYVGAEAAALLGRPEFLDALPGLMMPDAASQARAVSVVRRLNAIGTLAGACSGNAAADAQPTTTQYPL